MKIFVMAKKVLQSLFTKPATSRYPFVPKTYYKNTRGSIEIDISKCIFCGMCQRKCPTQAITVTKENKQWKINRLRCIACGYCLEVCPVKCLATNSAYAAATVKKTEEEYRHA